MLFNSKIKMENKKEQDFFNKFINFLKKYNLYNEKVFYYIWNSCSFFDYRDSDERKFIGVYYQIEDKKLIEFNLKVPFIDSEKTIIINIHEYIHALDAYYNLGKKITIDDSCEIKSLLFEKLYVLNNKSDEGLKYLESLYNDRIQSKELKYILGEKIVNELLKKYRNDSNFNYSPKKSKILLLKYKYLK